ncbi:MAG TPA: DUF4233 domain-containing protein, partial [Pilimelia sp.]|nr:DUF4233 domain-containing protein [Pilimelia sp.]
PAASGGAGPGGAGPGGAGPGGAAPEVGSGAPRPSGLRNPAAAVRGLGAATLGMEALALLLAIQPIRLLGGTLRGPALAAIGVLTVAAVVCAARMRHRWAWRGGGALQLALLAAGLLHWSLAVLGVVFGAVWLYVLHVRRVILG